jgi:hypothetical protein
MILLGGLRSFTRGGAVLKNPSQRQRVVDQGIDFSATGTVVYHRHPDRQAGADGSRKRSDEAGLMV